MENTSPVIVHPIPPIWNEKSRVLILGSFPSVKSREVQFFYGHPQNRFWRVIASVYAAEVPQTIDEKRTFLKNHQIALWDVIASCTIQGSADASIQRVQPTDLSEIIAGAPIRTVFCNGQTSYKLYQKYQKKQISLPVIPLPSTSPANAGWSLERLIDAWQIIRTE